MDIQIFFKKLDSLFAEKKIPEAETYMKESLAEAESSGDYPAVIAICSELGGYYRAVSNYEAGIPLYEKALRLINTLGQNGTSAHGTTLINYATMCTMKGDLKEALALYEQAAEIFSAPAFAGDFRLATLYNNMSFVCQDMKEFEKAENYLKKALSILEGLSESEIEIAVTCTNLGNLYAAEGRKDEAKGLLLKACRIFRTESGDRDVHYAAAVSALGDLYYTEGELAKAAEQFEKALQLIARDYGTDNDNYRIVEKNLHLCRAGETNHD